jgi:aminopeptidase
MNLFPQSGGRPAGSITAALFIKAFAEGCESKDGKPATLKWAHIDMAGAKEVSRAGDYYELGITGRPVR